MRLRSVPLELKEANAFIDKTHRHHDPVHRDKYRLGCEIDGKLVGVVQVGRPVARALCDGKTLEELLEESGGSGGAGGCSIVF